VSDESEGRDTRLVPRPSLGSFPGHICGEENGVGDGLGMGL